MIFKVYYIQLNTSTSKCIGVCADWLTVEYLASAVSAAKCSTSMTNCSTRQPAVTPMIRARLFIASPNN